MFRFTFNYTHILYGECQWFSYNAKISIFLFNGFSLAASLSKSFRWALFGWHERTYIIRSMKINKFVWLIQSCRIAGACDLIFYSHSPSVWATQMYVNSFTHSFEQFSTMSIFIRVQVCVCVQAPKINRFKSELIKVKDYKDL